VLYTFHCLHLALLNVVYCTFGNKTFPVRVLKLPPLHLKFRVIILLKPSILSSCFPSFCEARRIRLLHFSCNLAAVTIVLAISPFLLLTFHVLSTLRVLVTKSVRISYETESINFLCLVMMGTDDVCHQQKINDRRTVEACGSLFFPPFLFFFFPSSSCYYYYSTFNARRDDPRRHLVDGAGDGYKKTH